MSEENKYYTPTESDFFNYGIPFEIYEDFDVLPEKIWHEYVFGEQGTGNPENLNYPSSMSKLRVKLLDREDIESLGFGLKEFKGVPTFVIAGWNLTKFENNNIVSIDKISGNERLQQFRGVIKNISELRKLMEQLGIK